MTNLRSIVRDGLGSLSRRHSFGLWRKDHRERGRCASGSSSVDLGLQTTWGDGDPPRSWAAMPPELLREVVKRLELGGPAWPERRHLVAFASVCRSWRCVCKEIVGVPDSTGKITFPLALKQPGSRTGPIQCYIKRSKSSSTYRLFLGLDTDNGKFLMTARKVRRPTHSEYIISMSPKDFSCSSVKYMGKLRSNFLGTKFAIFDSQPPFKGAVAASTRHSSRRFYSKKVSPKVPSGNFEIAEVTYELNMLGTRGPRRMRCVMSSIPASALEPNGSVPLYDKDSADLVEEPSSNIPLSRSESLNYASEGPKIIESKRIFSSSRFASSSRFSQLSVDICGKGGPLILKNKPPRWHEQLQCWCLNFRGRVTVASVKNFQLIAASGASADGSADNAGTAGTGGTAGTTTAGTAGTGGTRQTGSTDHDRIILQFGKISRDLFTMDYRYPLSAFQAFAICLSSFDSKLACE